MDRPIMRSYISSKQSPNDAPLTPARFRSTQPLKYPEVKPVRRKKRSKNRRYRKDSYLEPDNRDIDSDNEIPSIAKIRLSSNTRKKLLEQRIVQLQELENKRQTGTRYSRRDNESRYSRRENESRYSKHETQSVYSLKDDKVLQLVKYNTYSLSSRGSNLPSVSVFGDPATGSVKSSKQFLYIPHSDHESGVFQHSNHSRDNRRNQRTSVLNKAENLINTRKHHEVETSSDEETPRVPTQVRKQRLTRPNTYVTSRSRSPFSDTEYVEVPEEIEPTSEFGGASPQPSVSSHHINRRIERQSGARSEIPIIYSDDDDGVYLEPRPYTDTERNRYPHYRRYEGENDNSRINYRDPAHKRVPRSTGALVSFLRNGDPHYKGVPFIVNDCYKNFESLLVALNEKIPTTTGVKYIFKLPEFTEIKSVTQFKNRCVYIVSSTKVFRRDVIYGDSRENHWSNKKPSAGRLRKNELTLYKKPRSPVQVSPTYTAPLIVTVINNLSRDKREKVILNPQTQQPFEDWLLDINSNDLPVKTLYTEKPPYSQVNSFSHLFRELKSQNNFIACGEEMLPLELTKKRQAPSSNSSSDSISDRGRKKKLPRSRDMGQIYEMGPPDSPTSTDMSRYDVGPKTYGGMRGRPLDSRKHMKDNVEIDIDGVVREFIPPSYMDPEDDGTKPDKQLRCEWVYGFRGRDARHNLSVLPKTGELVYYVASIVVLYDKERDIQRHYSKHNEEITCMMIHPNEYLIATGQLHGRDPEHSSHIRIWHGVTLSTYSVIGVGVFDRSIISIGFSQDGKGNYMCALDGGAKHVLSVWEWQTEKIIARTTTSTDTVHEASFYPDGSNNSILITYGARHIYFWKIFYDAARKREAKILRDRNSGIFEDDIPKCINCVEYLPSGDIVTGDTSGNLMVWDRDTGDAFTCKLVVQGHKTSVMATCVLEDGTMLSASGSEVKAWDTNSNFRGVKSRQIPIETGSIGVISVNIFGSHILRIPLEAGNIRSIVCQTPGGIDGKLFIGTTKGCILDGSLQQKFRYLVQGHCDDVYGAMPHPFEPTFISAGMDQVVYKWSLLTHKVIWRSQVESPCSSAAVNHRHELIAIGTSDGSIVVLNAYNGMHIASVDVGGGTVGCIAFSPDGTLLAVGGSNALIHIYAIHDRGQTFRKFKIPLKGHASAVCHLDWSSDGRSLQSVGENHELLFWDVDSMQPILIPRMMRDVDWFTNTCHVAYPLIGPWSNMEKTELITVVCRSNYRDLVITGDTKGRIRLYKYPCSKEKAEFRNVRVHSSEVTAVSFTPDNRCALTCGGNDAALIQWTLVDEQ